MKNPKPARLCTVMVLAFTQSVHPEMRFTVLSRAVATMPVLAGFLLYIF
jgi:hypothetical protein